jgi:hypothetical protein
MDPDRLGQRDRLRAGANEALRVALVGEIKGLGAPGLRCCGATVMDVPRVMKASPERSPGARSESAGTPPGGVPA